MFRIPIVSMNLPSSYRPRAAVTAFVVALAAWSVPAFPLHAQDAPPAPAVEAEQPADAPDAPQPAPEPQVERDTAQPAPTPPTPAPAIPDADESVEPIRLRELVTIMNSAHLRADETAPEMVTIMGNAIVDGVVNGDCVTVMGNVTVNGTVRGELVCVGGRITLGPGAEVRGEVVSVGGGVDAHATARIRGDKVTVTIPGFRGLGGWVAEWFEDGLGKARVLPHNHQWAWGAAAVLVLLNVLFAAMFSGAVTASARAVETRPVFAFVNGMLVMLLAPVLFVLLAASVIGIPLVPVAVAGLFLCWFLGTIGIYCFCGQQFGLGDRPVLAALVGNLVFLLLYALPIVGFAVWSVTGLMGLGAAVTAMGTKRRESREARLAARRAVAPPAPSTPPPPVQPQVQVAPTQPVYMAPPAPIAAPPPPTGSSGFMGGAAAANTAPTGATAGPAATADAGTTFVPPYSGWTPSPPPPPEVPTANAGVTVPPLPTDVVTERATFWPRLFAFVLDLVAVSVAVNVLGLGAFPVWVLAMFAYHILFWGWRGSTPAGIILNLQIVRDDGTPMDYRIAAVRALSGMFSLVPAGLGFIWVAFDRENQSWHDKLSGTSVVTVRKARPLI